MFRLTPDNVIDYLRDKGFLPAGMPARAELLAWGVSNQVIRIFPEGRPDFVVKQSREQLRTKADWFSRLDRIYREIEVMQAIEPLLPAGVIPRVLFEVRDDYLFGMEAVAASHVVWKGELLAGRFNPEIAALLGRYLGIVHRSTSGDQRLRERWSDRTVFDELRLDPFYRRIALVHPDLQPAVNRLIAENLGEGLCVVLADYSPKNVLVVDGGISLVDFETGHYGDPAFDLGFFLSHLLLKTVKHSSQRHAMMSLVRTFWSEYLQSVVERNGRMPFDRVDLERRTVANLAACMLARVDGKSTVDYLSDEQKEAVRALTRRFLIEPENSVEIVFQQLEGALDV